MKPEGSPAIAIDQRNRSHNPRSTVATVTELYDPPPPLRTDRAAPLPHLPHRHSRSAAEHGRKTLATEALGLASWSATRRLEHASDLMADGFSRAWNPDESGKDAEVILSEETPLDGLQLVVDRFNPETAEPSRIADSVALAYGHGSGQAWFIPREGETRRITEGAECPDHGAVLPGVLTPRHFSFNNHLGACTACDGLGRRTEIDPDKVLLKPSESSETPSTSVASVVFRSKPMKAMLAKLYKKFELTQDTPGGAPCDAAA